jgi:hypothetical protein
MEEEDRRLAPPKRTPAVSARSAPADTVHEVQWHIQNTNEKEKEKNERGRRRTRRRKEMDVPRYHRS